MKEDSSNPRLTVLIPAYNAGSEWLLESVKSVMAQTMKDLEIFIVDDGSTDGSVHAVKGEINDPRIHWIFQENMGKPATINKVMKMARGEFFAVQDADDFCDPSRFEKQIAALDADPTLAGVFCGYDMSILERRMAPTFLDLTKKECDTLIDRFKMPGHDPTACYRLKQIIDFKYAEDLRGVEGIDFILRVGERSPLSKIRGCFYTYRIHPDSITRSDPATRFRLTQEAIRRAYLRRGLAFGKDLVGYPTQAREDNGVYALFTMSVQEHRSEGKHLQSLRIAFDSIRVAPRDPYYYLPLLHCLLPDAFKRWWKSRR